MPNELKVRGRLIREDSDGFVCVTDIWKAAGFSKTQRPSDFQRLPQWRSVAIELHQQLVGKSHEFKTSRVWKSRSGPDGGTYAHPVLALAFTEYLNPALAVEVRQVFLRYKQGDESLVDEIRENKARREATDHELHRQIGKDVRKRFTKTLDEHGVKKPVEYALCTNEVYKSLLGGSAKEVREARGLHPKANLRDNMSLSELAYTMASEALAAERIEHQNSVGFPQCRDATKQASTSILSAIENDRRNRQQKLI